ncbi:DUF1016 N-terminal domain-containing protein [Flavobacterium denitrificans]|uniref:DUF1016 N-terminal domain-containing protein n=1 Tax=Flavobacterium denitrificans TaxID=281361 RepID=UPI000413DE2C|nr:DUF1016 N-terminal domain-containing protein [Flavobacterium denitrificans]
MPDDLQNKIIFQQVAELLQNARQQVLRTVNSTMTITYFEIGRIIVEEEQNGKDRAEYGKQLLKDLSKQLTKEFGRGFSIDNLENMRKLFLTFSKSETLSRILEIQKKTVSACGIQISKNAVSVCGIKKSRLSNFVFLF